MSTFPEEQLTLRDGRGCVIRLLHEADSDAMWALERDIIEAGAGVVKYPDELADAATYAEQLKRRSEMKGSLQLIAAHEEAILGEVSLMRFPLRMLRHVGLLAIGIHPSAQGAGLGRALFTRAVAWARRPCDQPGEQLQRLELYTRADNLRAIKLYQSLGFVIEGTRRGFIQQADGALVDDYVMGLLL